MENRNSRANSPDSLPLFYAHDEIAVPLDDLDSMDSPVSLDSNDTLKDPALDLMSKIGAKIIDLDRQTDRTPTTSMPLFIEPKQSSDQKIWDSYSDNITTPPLRVVHLAQAINCAASSSTQNARMTMLSNWILLGLTCS